MKTYNRIAMELNGFDQGASVKSYQGTAFNPVHSPGRYVLGAILHSSNGSVVVGLEDQWGRVKEIQLDFDSEVVLYADQ